MIVTELLIMKNLPEDLLGLTTKKESNKCKWILKIKTLLEWFNLKVLPFRDTSIWYADKKVKTIRKSEKVLTKSSNLAHCLERH